MISQANPTQIYLIDFGIADKFIDVDARHIEPKFNGYFSGNLTFASNNQCLGNQRSRKDDIESGLNLLIYLLNDKSLPWSQISSSKI